MPETNTKQIQKLQSQIHEQTQALAECKERVVGLQMRISQLVDDKVSLEGQLNKLQQTVAQDIKYLYDRLS